MELFINALWHLIANPMLIFTSTQKSIINITPIFTIDMIIASLLRFTTQSHSATRRYGFWVVFTKKTLRLVILSSLMALQACVSPYALDHAVIAYDQSTSEILSELLLLNVARAHQHQPLHFTGVSNIAASFNFQFNAGATPAMTGPTGSLITPIFGGTVSENPTISIIPMEGEEFTKRLLTPFQESKLTMLLRQGADVDLILRLLAGELRIESDHQDKVYNNKPSDKAGYQLFRQAVSHLSSIQDRNALFVEPLLFDSNWELVTDTLSPERLIELQKTFKVDYSTESRHLKLSKRVTGHIILTNYDPATKSASNSMKRPIMRPAMM